MSRYEETTHEDRESGTSPHSADDGQYRIERQECAMAGSEALSRAIFARLVTDTISGRSVSSAPQPDERELMARLSAYACTAALIHEQSLADARSGL